MQKPRLLIARNVYPAAVEKLQTVFDVETTPEGVVWTAEQLVERLQGKDAVLTTGSERIDAELLRACPRLKMVANLSVGFNNFDLPAMTAAGVLGTNAPGVLTETTADFGFALLMATARRITESEHFLRAGQWNQWSLSLFTGADVHGSTLGILGMGRIGQAIARRGAHGFGMRVIYHNRSRLDQATEDSCNAAYVTQDELLTQADHLVLVLPYSPEVHHLIDASALAKMKPSATLVNIARGGIVDEDALVDALRARRLAAAGLDVFEGEPEVNPQLLKLSNVVLTPHIASASEPTRLAMVMLAADNLIAFFSEGKALTALNPEVLNTASR